MIWGERVAHHYQERNFTGPKKERNGPRRWAANKEIDDKNDKTTFNEVRTYFLGKRYLSTDSSSPSWSLPCWTKMEINLIFWKEKREREKSGPFRKRLKGIERLHSIAFRAFISKEEGSTQRCKVNLLDSPKFAYAPAHCKYIGHLKNKFLFQQNKIRCQ